MRTIWQPTATSSSVCFTLAAVSIVSHVIMDCIDDRMIAADDDAAVLRIADDDFAGFAALIKVWETRSSA